jgi:hypothetical protein
VSLFVGIIFQSNKNYNEQDIDISHGFVLYSLYFVIVFKFLDLNKILFIFSLLMALLIVNRYKVFCKYLRDNKKALLYLFYTYFGLLNIFLLPIVFSGAFGPLTEGSGDITIYSNTVELFYKYDLPAFGYQEFAKKINEIIPILDLPKTIKWLEYPLNLSNCNYPNPLADSENLLVLTHFPTGWFSPVAQWYVFFHDSHSVFFALLGFLYASTVYVFYKTICSITEKRFIQISSMLILISSHSLVSTYYNGYLPHTISVFLLSFLLRLYFRINDEFRFFYVFWTISYSILTYFPFSPIIIMISIPLLYKAIKKEPISFFKYKLDWLNLLVGLIVFIIVFLEVVTQLVPSILKMLNNVDGHSSLHLLYLSTPIELFTIKFFSYLLGILSLQHFQPYVVESKSVLVYIYISIITFVFIIMIVLINYKKSYIQNNKLFFLFVTFTIVTYIYIGKNTEYTQAKGIQYILLLLHLIFLFFIAKVMQQRNAQLLTLLKFLLIIFILSIFLVRVEYAVKIIKMKDRVTILNSNDIQILLKNIQRKSDNPIVLFEPRKSSDIYLIPKIFYDFSIRYIPTKDLSLSKMNNCERGVNRNADRDLIASDFFDQQLTEDFFYMYYNKKYSKFEIKNFYDTEVIFTAHYYEKDYKMEVVNGRNMNVTYIRNGNAFINTAKHVEHKLKLYFKGMQNNEEIIQYLQNYSYKIIEGNWLVVELNFEDKETNIKTPKIWAEYYFTFNWDNL